MNYQETYSPDEILEYLRKSRADDPWESVEDVLRRHEDILRDWSDRNLGGPVPEENIFREVVSGETIEARPEMKRLLRMIESPRIKAVLVVEVQRLSRGDLEDAGRLIKLFRYTNTKVITPMKVYDISDDYDRDAFERELKRGNEYLEYTKKILNRGRIQSVMEGNFIGSIPPYGWKKVFVEDGKKKYPTLAYNEETESLRLIYSLCHDSHLRPVAIAHRLDELGIRTRKGGHWSAESIRDILTNPHNNGKVVWNWRKTVLTVEDQEVIKSRPRSGDMIIVDGKQPKLIDDDYFREVQEFLKSNTHEPHGKELRNPFAGILYCQCGHAMTMRTYKGKDGNERCAPRYACTDQAYCKTGSSTAAEIYKSVAQILEDSIRSFEFELEHFSDDKLQLKQVSILQARFDELCKKEISQWEKYSEEGMPKEIFDKLNHKVLEEKAAVEKALAEAKDSIPDRASYEKKIYMFRDALSGLFDDSLSAAEKNRLLKLCIERIVYHRDQPERLRRPAGEKKGTTLKVGGAWSEPPIQTDVTLKL